MLRFTSIASGSSGNSIYFGNEHTHILIDAGISNKRIEKGMADLGLKVSDLSAILITHEHVDHISGLKALSKKYKIPIYASKGTIEFIRQKGIIYEADGLIHTIDTKEDFSISDISVKAFPISHDAIEPVAYRLSSEGHSVAVATDMGTYDDRIIEELRGLDAIILEANHDIRMLEVGPYPYHLKRRILGDKGHLCNEHAGRLLSSILHDGIKHIFLGHLSKENNYASLAYETVKLEVDASECIYKGDDFPIEVAKRDELSSVISI